MALILFGNGVADARGSIAGTVFARNRSGAYARNRTKPVNPNTTAQSQVRQNLSDLQNYFRSALTTAQQNGWKFYAEQSPTLNRLGQSIKLTAINQFIRTNSLRLLAALSILDDAPATNGVPFAPILGLTCDTTDGLQLATETPAQAANEVLALQISPPKPFTVNFFRTGFVQSVYNVGVLTLPITLKPDTDVAIGQRYFVNARFMDATGRVSNQFLSRVDCLA